MIALFVRADEKIQESITALDEIQHTPEYEALSKVCQENKGNEGWSKYF